MIDLPSPNWNNRPAGIAVDMLVLHYTGMRTAAEALARLCDPAAEVSAHYVVDEDGTLYRLVPEDKRAWHAGLASWGGRSDVNTRSLGIELVNPGHEFGYRPFPEAQMAVLEALCRDILDRHAIPPANVVGHADVAPRRKADPGEMFDWRRLAAKGIGRWPTGARLRMAPPDEVKAWLAACGYETEDPAASLTAFQRHFRPTRCDGHPDPETVGLLAALAI
ncbi:MAG: N-acetylmuramoyl-L-alanine amidase [Magnetospirillum sp. WYHS-4]